MSVGGAVQGFFNGVKSFVSPINQPQQQRISVNPAQPQQPPNNSANPVSNIDAMVMLRAALNRKNNNQPGPSNGARPPLFFPIQSASPRTPAPPILTTINAGTTQVVKPSAVGMSLVSRSADSLSYASESDDTNPDVMGQRVDPERDPSKNGDSSDEGDESTVGDADFRSIRSVPPSEEVSSTCMLEGCSNPAFVDPITDLESEYCSQKHQELVFLSLIHIYTD